LGSTPLTAALSHAAIEPTDPGFDLRRFNGNKFYAASIVDSAAITQVRGSGQFLDYPWADKISYRFLLVAHMSDNEDFDWSEKSLVVAQIKDVQTNCSLSYQK